MYTTAVFQTRCRHIMYNNNDTTIRLIFYGRVYRTGVYEYYTTAAVKYCFLLLCFNITLQACCCCCVFVSDWNCSAGREGKVVEHDEHPGRTGRYISYICVYILSSVATSETTAPTQTPKHFTEEELNNHITKCIIRSTTHDRLLVYIIRDRAAYI